MPNVATVEVGRLEERAVLNPTVKTVDGRWSMLKRWAEGIGPAPVPFPVRKEPVVTPPPPAPAPAPGAPAPPATPGPETSAEPDGARFNIPGIFAGWCGYMHPQFRGLLALQWVQNHRKAIEALYGRLKDVRDAAFIYGNPRYHHMREAVERRQGIDAAIGDRSIETALITALQRNAPLRKKVEGWNRGREPLLITALRGGVRLEVDGSVTVGRGG